MAETKKIIPEAELVSLLKQGDQTAFSYLYDNYNRALFQIVFNVLQNQELSEDALQEAFVKIWKNIGLYDNSKGTLFTWMLNVCRNIAIDKTRSKGFKNNQQNQNIETTVSVSNKSSMAIKPELIGIKQLAEKLKPEFWEIIELIYFKGYTQSDVAETLDIPLGTVKTRCRMAMLELRTNFN